MSCVLTQEKENAARDAMYVSQDQSRRRIPFFFKFLIPYFSRTVFFSYIPKFIINSKFLNCEFIYTFLNLR
jgi:hypothetical protein